MIDRLKKAVEVAHGKYLYAKARIKEEKAALQKAKDTVEFVQQAQQILQVIAQEVQTKAHERIAKIVTRCLKAVFQQDAYEFKIVFERKRGRTDARLSLVRDGIEYDPNSVGGGVVDVASFALRLTCLVIAQPPKRRLVVLDEPFKFLSRNYAERVQEMLEDLSEELDMQFIMVTHDPQLEVGKVIEID